METLHQLRNKMQKFMRAQSSTDHGLIDPAVYGLPRNIAPRTTYKEQQINNTTMMPKELADCNNLDLTPQKRSFPFSDDPHVLSPFVKQQRCLLSSCARDRVVVKPTRISSPPPSTLLTPKTPPFSPLIRRRQRHVLSPCARDQLVVKPERLSSPSPSKLFTPESRFESSSPARLFTPRTPPRIR